jgi:hypothetical protein
MDWSLITPTFCINAYTLVGPTKRVGADYPVWKREATSKRPTPSGRRPVRIAICGRNLSKESIARALRVGRGCSIALRRELVLVDQSAEQVRAP